MENQFLLRNTTNNLPSQIQKHKEAIKEPTRSNIGKSSPQLGARREMMVPQPHLTSRKTQTQARELAEAKDPKTPLTRRTSKAKIKEVNLRRISHLNPNQ